MCVNKLASKLDHSNLYFEFISQIFTKKKQKNAKLNLTCPLLLNIHKISHFGFWYIPTSKTNGNNITVCNQLPIFFQNYKASVMKYAAYEAYSLKCITFCVSLIYSPHAWFFPKDQKSEKLSCFCGGQEYRADKWWWCDKSRDGAVHPQHSVP